MAVQRCGWCGTLTHVSVFGEGIVEQLRSTPDGRERYRVQAAFSCDQCHRLSVGSYEGPVQSDGTYSERISQFFNIFPIGEWAPQYPLGQDFPDVPDHIATAASEAHRGESVRNYMSAILMARTVIEATAKDKGIASGTLETKIERMVQENFIRPNIKAVADEVRHFGNDMAHGDIGIPVTQDDAVEVLALMDEILNEVYQGPARLAAVKARRLERKKPK